MGANGMKGVAKTNNSFILPYLQYCSIIWASTYSSHLQPLFRFQKKAIRIITHSPPRSHTYPLFNRLKILNIFNIYKHQLSCFIFLHIQKLLPSPLSSLFWFNSDCHQYFTDKKTTYIFILISTLLHFVYKALKFGIASLSPYVIRLRYQII